jgi:Asp-tRNA(Asn)/Glu-tRNA(Gln) amidotransferase B subunit
LPVTLAGDSIAINDSGLPLTRAVVMKATQGKANPAQVKLSG